MSVKVYRGKTKTMPMPVAASLALVKDTLLEFTSGTIGAADDNDTLLLGILAKTLATTDADYALARNVPVIVPRERHVVYEMDVTSGQTGVAATHVGTEVGIDSSGTLDLTDTTNKVFLITEVIAAGAKVRGFLKINGSY